MGSSYTASYKKSVLVAASALLAFVLLTGFVNFAQCQLDQPPTLVSPGDNENISDNAPLMDWQDVTGADNYHIQIDNDSDYSTPNENDNNVGNTSEYQVAVENALPDGIYYWHVRAENENSENYGPWSDNWRFRVDTLAPLAPSLGVPDNELNDNSATQTFTWEDLDLSENSLPVLYHIQIDSDSNFSSPENENIWQPDNSYTTTLQDNVWYWRVRGRDNAGNVSTWSGVRWVRVDTLAPVAPTLASPENNENTNDNTPNLDWATVTDNSTPVLYRSYVSDNSEFPYDNYDSDWISDDNYQLPSELTEGSWYWRVMAKDNAGNEGDNSGWWRFQVDVTAPLAPTLVSPDNGAQTAASTPTLSWTAVSDNSLPVTYDLQVDDDSGFSSPTENVSGLTDNSYTTSSLADGTWYWRVRASDNAGNAGNWSSRSFTVDTAAPTAPALTAPANGAFTNDVTPTFNWEPVSGAASYTIQYATNSGFTQNLTTISSTATNYTPTAALAGGTWHWRVRTVDTVGNISGWSSTWLFNIDTATPTVTISPLLDATPTATGWRLTTTNSSIEISGSVIDATGVTVKINDKVVPVVGSSFSKTVSLAIGTNTFTLTITDAAGNSTTRTLSVTRAVSGPLPVAAPIPLELVMLIVAIVAIVIVVMVLVKMVLVRKY